MNQYFNESMLKSIGISFERDGHWYESELKDLIPLLNMEVELLLTNPFVEESKNHSIYRPENQIFKKDQELVFAGCSQTHGDHISPPLAKQGDHNQIWGFLVAEALGLDAVNLGVGAEGCYRIVQRLFGYFATYGNPKTLICLFPDMYRLTTPKDENNLVALKPYGTFKFLEGTFHSAQNIRSTPQFSKKPYKKEDVISRFVPLFFNIQAIHMLDQYCKSSGIKFMWGSWDPTTNAMVRLMKAGGSKSFKSYVDLDKHSVNWEDVDCHKEIYDKYPDLYLNGIDGQHMGMHRHAHIAEGFAERFSQ